MTLGHRRNVRACILVLAFSAALLVAVTSPSFVLQGGDNVELEETPQLAQNGEQCWMCPCCAGCEATAAARATGCDFPKAKAVHGEAKKQKERDAAQHALNLANGRIKLLQAKLEQAKLASKNNQSKVQALAVHKPSGKSYRKAQALDFTPVWDDPVIVDEQNKMGKDYEVIYGHNSQGSPKDPAVKMVGALRPKFADPGGWLQGGPLRTLMS